MHICPKCLEEFDDADDFFEHYTMCDEEEPE